MGHPRKLSCGLLVIVGALALLACDGSRALDTALTNDLRGAGPAAPPGPSVNVARGGIPDDSIKPKPTVNVAKVGTADDGVKPAPQAGKVGTADDGVKPAAPGRRTPGTQSAPRLPPAASSATP